MEAGGDDGELIERSLADPAAFAGIFDRHASVLLGYLTRRVGSIEAEDLLGELFRQAFESRVRYDSTRPDSQPWLYGIAANLVMKHFRRRARHDNAVARLGSMPAQNGAAGFEQAFVDGDADVRRLDAAAALIDALPERDREVAVLFAWQELSYDEIAEALEIPVGTVRSRLNRVRGRLRELDERRGESPVIGTDPGQEAHGDE